MHVLRHMLCVLVLGAAPARADGPATVPGPVAQFGLSRTLYDLGLARADAALVLAAGRIRKAVSLDPGAAAATGTAGVLGWEEMLDTAETLAGSDPVMLGLVADARVERLRGVNTGALYWSDRLAPGAVYLKEPLTFDGAGPAEVYVEGRGAADLDLVVTEADGAIACADRDASPIAHCFWQPQGTRNYSIRIENKGPEEAPFLLLTN